MFVVPNMSPATLAGSFAGRMLLDAKTRSFTLLLPILCLLLSTLDIVRVVFFFFLKKKRISRMHKRKISVGTSLHNY